MRKRFLRLCSVLFVLIMLISSFSVLFTGSVSAEDTELPDFVDNSTSIYFPAIGNQGSQGACCCWGQVYYQFTYMMNRSMGVATTPENTFSPTFAYNIANGGRNQGTWDVDVFGLSKEIGNLPMSMVTHQTEDYNNWYTADDYWKEAMKYRIKDYYEIKDAGLEKNPITSPDDTDLYEIKKFLNDGEVLAATCYINSWNVKRLKTHSNAPENDKYENQYVVTYSDGTRQRHRICVVGYNDNIWCDINENGNVDSGEMGAFKIANSWGVNRHNEGYMWVAYDAVNKVSSVVGCPATEGYRPLSLCDFVSIEVISYDTDADLYFKYTLNTCDRSQGKIYATATHTDGTEYTFEIGPKRQHGMYASTYSYDGTTDSNDGTMYYALSNVVPDISPETLHQYIWSIKFEDTNADGKAFTVKNMEIVDESTGRISKPENVYSFVLDGSSKTVVFPQFEEYVPATTTVAPTTTEAQTTVSDIITQPTETEPTEIPTVPVTETEAVTTVIPTETLAVTEPTETTTEVIVTTATPTEATTVAPTETTTTATEPTETTTESVITTAHMFEEYIYGDSNCDGVVKINDATLIQKYVAFLVDTDALNEKNADCNLDLKVSVKDATCIQKYLAKLAGYVNVGEKYTVQVTYPTEYTEATTAISETVITTTHETTVTEAETTAIITEPTEAVTTTAATEPTEVITTIATEPESATAVQTEPTEATTATVIPTETTAVITEPATQEPTTEPVTEPKTEPVVKNVVTFTNSHNWQGIISCYYWSDSNKSMTAWPGEPMQNAGQNEFGETLYTFNLPDGVTYVIFTNGSVQTVDIPYIGGDQKFYPVAPDSSGKYTVNNW